MAPCAHPTGTRVKMRPMPNDDRIRLEIDGPGVSPASLSTTAALDLASGYFSLVERLSEDMSDEPVRFSGLALEDKCAAFAVGTSAPPDQLWEFVGQAMLVLAGTVEPPTGTSQLVSRARSAMRRLPGNQSVRLIYRGMVADLPRAKDHHVSYKESTTLLVRPIRVGGSSPTVRLASSSEEEAFTVRLRNEDQARAIAAFLYQEIEAELVVQRGPGGAISTGTLESFSPLQQGDPATAWRAWFAQNGGAFWATVEDIDAELGRNES